MNGISYKFKEITECDMCKAPASQFRYIGRRMNRSQGKYPKKKTAILTTIQKCANCGLIFSNPLPIPNRVEDHYNLPPEEYWEGNYFTPDPEGIKAIVEKAILYGGQNGKILDIGSGVGFAMKAMLDAGLDVTGIEPSEPFVNYAVSKNNIPRSKIILSALEDAELPLNSFDYVNMGAVLEHLYSPSDALKLVLKWVKPGGKIEIEVPNAKWLINRLFNLYYKLTLQPFAANISPMHAPFHITEFTLKSFIENGKINGYKIIKNYFFIAPTYLPAFLNVPLKYYMKKTNTGMQLMVVLEKMSK